MITTKPGVLPTELIYTGKCDTCKGEFSATGGELTKESDYRNGFHYQAKCGTDGCSHTVTFELKEDQ